MSKRKPKIYNPELLIKAIKKWPNPMYDKRHKYYIYVEGRARTTQTRVEHIVEFGHDLKVRDLEMVPEGIFKYFEYKKDPIYKNTFNYYLIRKGKDRGFIKISIQVDHKDSSKAWIKTIYIAHKIK